MTCHVCVRCLSCPTFSHNVDFDIIPTLLSRIYVYSSLLAFDAAFTTYEVLVAFTGAPTPSPTGAPSQAQTEAPSKTPTGAPSGTPTGAPTVAPSGTPTGAPTGAPTIDEDTITLCSAGVYTYATGTELGNEGTPEACAAACVAADPSNAFINYGAPDGAFPGACWCYVTQGSPTVRYFEGEAMRRGGARIAVWADRRRVLTRNPVHTDPDWDEYAINSVCTQSREWLVLSDPPCWTVG